MKKRLRIWFNEWRCWFYFGHRMESLGKMPNGHQLYQCAFCFKRIAVRPFGSEKGVLSPLPNPLKPEPLPDPVTKSFTGRNFIGQPK